MTDKIEVKFQATTIETDKGFQSSLTKARESVESGFSLIQDCILYGLEKYRDNSADSSYLSRAVAIAGEIKGMNANQVKAYIQEHANVMLRKVEDGSFKFKKTGKGPATVTMPIEGYNWWNEVSEARGLRADMVDPVGELQKLIKRIKDKEAKGLLPESRKDMFHELEAMVAPIMKLEPLPSEQLHSDKQKALLELDKEAA